LISRISNGISSPTSVPTTTTTRYSSSSKPGVSAKAMKSTLDEKPPTMAMKISIRTNWRARLPRT